MTGVDGALTRTPENTTLLPGTLLRLNCSSKVTDPNRRDVPVLWNFTPVGSNNAIAMTSLGYLTPRFAPYFFVDSTSLYDLVAQTSNANVSYCGTYTCVEDNGAGYSATASVASKCV